MNAVGLLSSASLAKKVPAAVASAVLLVLALPKPDFYPLAWIALVPLLLVISADDGQRRTFVMGYAAGLAYFSGTCYWMFGTMATYGGLAFGAALGVLALFVVVFAFHTALFVLLVRMMMSRFGDRGLLLAAPAWVTVELVQTYLIFGGFPWMLAGYALAPFGGLLQVATWTGIYGLSFLLVVVNSLIALGIRASDWRPLATACAIVAAAFLLPTPALESPADPFEVRLVQTNIDIDQPWDTASREQLMAELVALSISGNPSPDLIVWPETPAPFYLGLDEDLDRDVEAISSSLDSHFLLGYIGVQGEELTNSAGLVSPAGDQISRYDKIHLVPFGEYVPLGNILFFAESLVRNVGNFAAGSNFTTSALDNHRIATAICYEAVFPALMRQFASRGAEAIVNISNDGWFGSTSAPYQHLRMAVVRAVESRRYVVRATNTGITAIIDPYGNVVASTQLGERTLLDGVAGYRNDLTVYVRVGDVFAYAMALLFVTASLVGRRHMIGGGRT